jgi:uncharacterized membrane protein
MSSSPVARNVIQPTMTAPALLLGLVGGALFASRRRLPTPARAAATVGGLALISAAAHRPIVEAVRQAGTRRRSGTVAISFIVAHPVETVFGFCRDFENFPQFIGALREVRDYGDGRSHWCASTPAGGTIEWDTVTTKYVPNRVIAWTSVGGSPIETNARVRFIPEGRDTCVKIDATYRVMDSSMADAIAALITPQRKGELAADVRRLGPYLDSLLAGTGPARAGA